MANRRRSHQGDVAQAADVLRCILSAVEAGELDAHTPRSRRLLRQLEGAQAAWDVELRNPADEPEETGLPRE